MVLGTKKCKDDCDKDWGWRQASSLSPAVKFIILDHQMPQMSGQLPLSLPSHWCLRWRCSGRGVARLTSSHIQAAPKKPTASTVWQWPGTTVTWDSPHRCRPTLPPSLCSSFPMNDFPGETLLIHSRPDHSFPYLRPAVGLPRNTNEEN